MHRVRSRKSASNSTAHSIHKLELGRHGEVDRSLQSVVHPLLQREPQVLRPMLLLLQQSLFLVLRSQSGEIPGVMTNPMKCAPFFAAKKAISESVTPQILMSISHLLDQFFRVCCFDKRFTDEHCIVSCFSHERGMIGIFNA